MSSSKNLRKFDKFCYSRLYKKNPPLARGWIMLIPMEIAGGFKTGEILSRAKAKNGEFSQKKQKDVAAFCRAYKVSNLSNFIVIGNSIPNSYARNTLKVCGLFISGIGFACTPDVPTTDQRGQKNKVVKFASFADRFPITLGKKTHKVCHFLAKHEQYFSTGLFIAGLVTVPVLGNGYFAAGMLAPLSYQAAESCCLVSNKVSLFMENYMSALPPLISIIAGDPLSKVFSLFHLMTYLPSFNQSLHRKIEKAVKGCFKLEGPSLEEIEAPLVIRQYSFHEIQNILFSEKDRFTINPAHCSKAALGAEKLPKNRQFAEFLTLFNQLSWTKDVFQLNKAFRQDEHFLDFLKKTFPGKLDYQEKFDEYLQRIVKNSSVSASRYLADLLEKRLIKLVHILQEKERAKGSQKDISEVMDHFGKILAYLSKKNLEFDEEREVVKEMIIASAMQSEYGLRAIKEVSRSLVNRIVLDSPKLFECPVENYEQRLLHYLEIKRFEKIAEFYQQFIFSIISSSKSETSAKMREAVTDSHALAISQDRDIFELYRLAFSLGFVPLSDHEKNLDISTLYMWSNSLFRKIRQEMYREYQSELGGAIANFGSFAFFDYLRQVLDAQTNLTPKQVGVLIELFSTRNDKEWTDEETENRFFRLMLVMRLGVLNYDSTDDWTVIPAEEEVEEEEMIGELHEKKADEWVDVDDLTDEWVEVDSDP